MTTDTTEQGDQAALDAPRHSADAAAHVAYEPALDGLRAVAVFGVLVFHEHGPSSQQLGRGGFLGVDLFFVLSGYLITTLLLAERNRTGGIALASFWQRRARRLLPALFIAIGLAVLYAHLYGAPLERREIKDGIIPALFYYQNWHSISHQASVLSPTWSLAIEEQWYLVWPIVLWLLLRRRGRPSRAVIAGVACAAVVSAAWTWHLAGASGLRVYYGTDTRGQSLLVGACLALVAARVGRPTSARATLAIDAIAGAALAFVIAVFVDWESTAWLTFHGGIFLVALASAALIIAATQPGSRIRRILSWRPFVAIGLISYGVYLYSYPLTFIVSGNRGAHLRGNALFTLRVVVTLAVAYVSWRFIEQPIRRAPASRRWPWVVIAAGLVLSLVGFGTLQAPSLAAATRLSNTPLQRFLNQYHVLALAAPPSSTPLLVVGGSEAAALDSLSHPYHGTNVYGVAADVRNCGLTSADTPAAPGAPANPCGFAPNLLVGINVAYRPAIVAVTIEAADVVDRTIDGHSVRVGSSTWVHDASAQLDAFRKRLPPGVRRLWLVGGCGPDSTASGDATGRADAVWAEYAHTRANVSYVAAPPSVCAHHVPSASMWPWLAHTVKP